MNQDPPRNPGATERAVSLALAAVLALLPLLPTGPEYLGLPPGAWVEGAIVLLLIIALVSMVLEHGYERPSGPLRTWAGVSPLIWGWLAFLVAVLGATAVGILRENEVSAPVFTAYLRELPAQLMVPMNQATHPLYPARLGLTFLEGFLAFVLVVWICSRATDVRRRALVAVSGWTTGFGLTAGFAVFQFVTRFRLHPYWVEVNPNLVRSHSTLDDPNALGAYLCFGLGLAVGLYLVSTRNNLKPWAKWATASAVLVGLLALGSTVSRSSWAAAVLATALFLASPLPTRHFDSKPLAWLRKGARGTLLVLLLVVTLSLAARAFVSPRPGYKPTSLPDAIVATLDPRIPLQDVLEGRQIWWTAGSRMFLEHPIAGAGLGRFPRLLPEYQDIRQINENAHNFYLQVAAVMGSIGLAAFLFFLVTFAATLRPALAADGKETSGLALGLALGMLAFLLTCLTGHSLLLPSVQLLLATGLAAGLVAVAPHAGSERRLWRIGTLILALIALLGYTVAGFRAPGPSASNDPWGYEWGLYATEVDPTGVSYRWTQQRALLYFVPPEGAQWVELNYAVAEPVRNGLPTDVWIQVGDETHSDYCSTDGWCQVIFPLPEQDPGRGGRGIVIRVTVDPPLIPGAAGESDDFRQLGLMLRAPRFLPPP